jgi:DNA-binding PadR family transcriptional regulator
MDLTTLEQQILAVILALRGDGYGVSIRAKIEETTRRAPSLGSVYASLDRLEERGFIASRQGEATAERGGRRKLLFRITAPGQRALNESLNAVGALARIAGMQGALA